MTPSEPVGTASVRGTVNGRSFTPRDAVGIQGVGVDSPVPEAGAIITDAVVSCSYAEQNTGAGAANGFEILVSASGNPVTPGTYDVATYPAVRVRYLGSCLSVNELAQAGTVTLRSISSDAVVGAFDVTFASGDHVTAEFSAPVCEGLLAALTSSRPPPPACATSD